MPKNLTGLGVYARSILPAFERFTGVIFAPIEVNPPSSSFSHIISHENMRSGTSTTAQLRRLVCTETVLPRLRKDKRDLIFSPHPEAPQFSGRKVVVVHDLIPLVTEGHSQKIRQFFKHYVIPISKKSEIVITDSNATRQDLRSIAKIPEDRIRVIPLGVNFSEFNPITIVEKKPYFIYIGRQDKYKNVEACIRGLAAVPDKNCRLKIAGPENVFETPRLIEIAEKLGISHRIEFLNYLSFPELVTALQNATALVHLSSYEGFGLTILEAMAAGTAVICSKAAAILEAAGGNAWSVEPTATNDVAEAMYKLLSCPVTRRAHEVRGLSYAQNCSWNKAQMMLSNEIKKIL